MSKNPVRVHFASLGCPKNLVDSEVMLGRLGSAGWQLSEEPDGAELIVVNTCAFIESAKRESIDAILELARWKKKGRCRALVVAGCLAQRYWKDLEADMPEVDLFVGTGEYHRIAELVAELMPDSRTGTVGKHRRAVVGSPEFIHSDDDARVHTGRSHLGFLKISEGCNRRCSFCAIPAIRGNVRSRSIDSLVREAGSMARSGVRELSLVAQDLTEYGMEGKYRERLETLLPALCRVDGIRWIRLHYVYPDDFSDELVECIAREDRIVKYLDLPIQHTSDRILGLMGRRITRTRLFELIAKLRTRIPGIVIRTSIIVGFPTETEKEFEAMMDDLGSLDLDHVGVFSFSREEGTAAAALSGQVPAGTRRRRVREFEEGLAKLAVERGRRMVGTRSEAIIDGPSAESEHLIEARLPSQAWEIDGRLLINDLGSRITPPSAGEIVQVEIRESVPPDLVAAMVS